jgi:hypothetical protein
VAQEQTWTVAAGEEDEIFGEAMLTELSSLELSGAAFLATKQA